MVGCFYDHKMFFVISKVLQSELVDEPRDNLIEREAVIELKENIQEQELFLEFFFFLILNGIRRHFAQDSFVYIFRFKRSYTIIDIYSDIHYPVVEMSSGSKLSSICWNNNIKGQIASSNFKGVLQLQVYNYMHMENSKVCFFNIMNRSCLEFLFRSFR
ncbi:putative WD40/YVTN repeat-like-containing domain superfamily [Helianthus anomalus]